jgi:hypothetical protein
VTEQSTAGQDPICTETAQGLAVVLADLDAAKARLINSTLDEAPRLAFEYMAIRDRSSAAFEAAQREYDSFRAENPDFDPASCGEPAQPAPTSEDEPPPAPAGEDGAAAGETTSPEGDPPAGDPPAGGGEQPAQS